VREGEERVAVEGMGRTNLNSGGRGGRAEVLILGQSQGQGVEAGGSQPRGLGEVLLVLVLVLSLGSPRRRHASASARRQPRGHDGASVGVVTASIVAAA